MNKLWLAFLALGLVGCAPATRMAGSDPGSSPAAEPFDAGGYPTEVCDPSYAGRAAVCTFSGAANGSRQAIRANLISGGRLYIGGTLLIDAAGRVESASCLLPPQTDTVVLDCPGALLSAGFLNLHEHIDYSYQQPAAPPVLKWQHRNEWRRLSAAERGFEGNAPADKAVATEVSERAMLRHALSGATAISGAKDYQAFLRNLKLPAGGALASPFGAPLLDNTFPVGDAASMAILSQPCTPQQVAAVRFTPANPFIPHVGEGTGEGARFEVDCVLDALRGKASPSAFIHGVAISEAQIGRLKEQGVAVVLSPRSNFQLYGATAPVTALKAAGVTLAIGTDWSPSGSLTVLDEARCLDRFNRDKLQGLLRASDLHRMLTVDGARAVGLAGQVGALAAGEWADLVLLDTEGQRSLGEILARTALPQTLAVMVGGRVSSAPLAWAGRLPQLDSCSPDPRDLCGSQRLICGANPQRPLANLLQQATYTIDDSRICRPQPTDDCVQR